MSPNKQDKSASVNDILESMRDKGVHLWVDKGQLRYRSPKGALRQSDVDTLRECRERILSFLETMDCANGTERTPTSLPALRRFPLAFSQLARWYSYETGERRPMRQLASATRLRGRLDTHCLQQSIQQVVHRHDALRTQIVTLDGVPIQEISENSHCELKTHDLRALQEEIREREVDRIIRDVILEQLDFAVGPLCTIELLSIRDDEHVLIVAMEHIISDGFSLGILLRELFFFYVQAIKCASYSMPRVPIQFGDYAMSQRAGELSFRLKRAATHLREHLAGCERLAFPLPRDPPLETGVGWGIVPLRIDGQLKSELQDWSRKRRTTLVMAVLNAYVGLVLRWCGASESVVQYQADCRVGAELEKTIGFFTSALYLRVRLLENDRFGDLLDRLTQEYCEAYEHVDLSLIAAQHLRPGYSRNTTFNWIPQGGVIDLSELEGSEYEITSSTMPLMDMMVSKLELDQEPGIVLYDHATEVIGGIHFPLNRFAVRTMERFANAFMVFINNMLKQPETLIKDISLV